MGRSKETQQRIVQVTGYEFDQTIIDWVCENIPVGSSILELGSGDGSNHLVKLGYHMSCIEDKIEWAYKHGGITYLHVPLKDYGEIEYFKHQTKWYNREVLKSALKNYVRESYSLIIVDGPEGESGRGGFYSNLDLFDTTVPILIDNIDRGPELLLAELVASKVRNKRVINKYETNDERMWCIV